MAESDEFDIERQEGAANPEKADQASNSAYDNFPAAQRLDKEMRRRMRHGSNMALVAVIALGVLTIIFFGLAAYIGIQFFCQYTNHAHLLLTPGEPSSWQAMVPLMALLVPASLFSIVGVITMITTVRFITSYSTHTELQGSDSGALEGLAREIAGILKAWKGNSPE